MPYNNETVDCPSCGNVNTVLVSSGFKNPENKGKRYFTCSNCKEFYWVGEDGPYSPRGGAAKPKTAPRQSNNEEFAGWQKGNSGNAQNSTKTDPDWDAIARGKVRHGIVVATIENRGLVPLTTEDVALIETYVDYVMNGPKS